MWVPLTLVSVGYWVSAGMWGQRETRNCGSSSVTEGLTLATSRGCGPCRSRLDQPARSCRSLLLWPLHPKQKSTNRKKSEMASVSSIPVLDQNNTRAFGETAPQKHIGEGISGNLTTRFHFRGRCNRILIHQYFHCLCLHSTILTKTRQADLLRKWTWCTM